MADELNVLSDVFVKRDLTVTGSAEFASMDVHNLVAKRISVLNPVSGALRVNSTQVDDNLGEIFGYDWPAFDSG